MRILALDVGEKRIGVAVSDALGITARGLCVIRRTDLPADLEKIRALVRDEGAERILVGLPIHMDGSESEMSARIREFGRRLEEATVEEGISVRFWDERLSSREAEQVLRERGLDWRARKSKVDQVAAAVFLQEYLDDRAGEGSPEAGKEG